MKNEEWIWKNKEWKNEEWIYKKWGICNPIYASMFMAEFEERYIWSNSLALNYL